MPFDYEDDPPPRSFGATTRDDWIKRKVPARSRKRDQTGTNRGMGVRQALFPVLAFGAHPLGGCQLPDAILHGKRSLRPRSRAVQRLASAEF